MGRGRCQDMTGFGEAVRSALGDRATGDLAERIERELTARGLHGAAEDRWREPERCGRCGGLKDEREHERNSNRVCRCGGRRGRLLSYLDAADPDRRMTLDALDVSEPTVAAVLKAARGIVSGERRRGMLLIGLPGRDKTHLMVGLGRALVARDRDAGFYNVVRLVSRLQDSYSDFGGETGDRRVGGLTRGSVPRRPRQGARLDKRGVHHLRTLRRTTCCSRDPRDRDERSGCAGRGLPGPYPVRALRRGGAFEAQGDVRALRYQGRGPEGGGVGVVDTPPAKSNSCPPARPRCTGGRR